MRLCVATLIALMLPLTAGAADCLFGGCLASANRAADRGRDVRITDDGNWAPRARRLWAKQESSDVISEANSDQRNGELAYQTAFDSFLAGKKSGRNRTQHVKNGGRWVRKITTGDGIVLFKDSAGNVAVQSPDGKWHVTSANGEYASTSLDLERSTAPEEKTMVAEKAAPSADRAPASVAEKTEAPAKEEKTEAPVAEANKAPDTPAPASASEAPAAAEAAAPAAAPPAAPAAEAAAATAAPAAPAAEATATAAPAPAAAPAAAEVRAPASAPAAAAPAPAPAPEPAASAPTSAPTPAAAPAPPAAPPAAAPPVAVAPAAK